MTSPREQAVLLMQEDLRCEREMAEQILAESLDEVFDDQTCELADGV